MRGPMKILGIDPGYRNFAYCLVNSHEWHRPEKWGRTELFSGPCTDEKLVTGTASWCTRNAPMLEEADHIVIEYQKEKAMAIIATVIRAQYMHKTSWIHPATVGAFFHLPRERAEKKKAAVVCSKANVGHFPKCPGKADDMADAYLLAMHRIFNEEFVSQEGWRHYEPGSNVARHAKHSKGGNNNSAGKSRKRARGQD